MAPDKRKKFHDKDKYYRLAKEQGLRSRAAFKLSQINRKYKLLEGAKVVLDLCAAPGGWTQVVSRAMPRSGGGGGIIIAVDILPIRALPNVITLIGDITTEQCKAEISRELQNAKCDLVLHDGAPNVGASYDKDAYEQNEIALHALKCATQHLKARGNFVTKLYRSRDYASYVWVAKQLFETVQAVKPSSSRSQSAEIFLVCENYKAANTKIDPRMLDPKCIFEQVEGDSTGGGVMAGTKQFNIFHKNWDAKRRQRDGYDMSRLDASMRHIEPISEFVRGKKDPIEMLSTCTGLSFQCEVCDKDREKEEDEETKDACNCQFFLNHRLTSSEIKACVSDLKVLNKSDFKGLLTWRTKMQDALKEQREKEDASSDEDASDDDSQGRSGKKEINSDEEEEEIQAEIADMRRRRLREKKKIKKKERLQMAKRRKKAALGMDLNAVDVPEHDEIFSLATITSKGALEVAREVDLGKVTDEQLAIGENQNDDNGPIEGVNSDGEVESQGEDDDLDENTGYSYRLDRELDSAYDTYLKNTKNGLAKSGTKMGKRSKKLQRQKALEEANEDTEMMLTNEEGIDNDTKTYAKMLQGPKDSDDEDSNDDSSDEEDDGFNDEPLTPAEHAAKKKAARKEPGTKKPKEESNPLIYKLPEDPKSVKTARWFSNPLFESLGNTAQLAAMAPGNGSSKQMSNVDDYDSEDSQTGEEDIMSVNSDTDASSDDEAKNSNSKGISADEVLASMPKTDKQVRHEKRLKSLERLERKKARRARQAGETDADFEVAPGAAELGDEILKQDEKLDGLSVEQKKKVLEARALIKAGMGTSTEEGGSGFEVVPATDNKRPLPIMDHRKYDSENEDYDSDDYAQTLALGTMMLRQSKAKALVDASYNRFSWNDPGDLPDWFVDDENKHYRPQLPVPPALLAKMKEKVMALAVRPIAKVAEARARKSKRARLKLTAAKKKAEAVAANSDMSETMKLKAISKAMRGQDSQRSGSKKYAVAKKGVQGSKGVKTLDKRMKSDKRGLERAEKRKNGTRSKKRRR